MTSKVINHKKSKNESLTDSQKEDALLDETMKLIAGYEEGLSARDFKSMSDCNCQTHDNTKHKKK